MFKTKLEHEIVPLKELCFHMGRVVEKLDEDPCFCNAAMIMCTSVYTYSDGAVIF